jgi:hypothetical protein
MKPMDETLAKAVPYLMIAGGAGQVVAGVEVAKVQNVAEPIAQATGWAAMVLIIPGVIFAIGGVLQIVLNYLTKEKRIEIETRLKRLEMGLPCDDAECPIQKIASRRVARFDGVFNRPIKGGSPSEDTVDLS